MTISWIKFAIANLFRNRRRSFYTIFAVAMGFASVNVFGGFTEYIFLNLKDSFIYLHGNGHLTVFKEGFLSEGRADPVSYLITKEESDVIREVCSMNSNILLTTPQLQILGLISNGNVSTVFVGNGRVPSDTQFIRSRARGMIGQLEIFKGKELGDDVIHGVGLTTGLADILKLNLGSNVVTIAPTVDGRVNALEAEVFQTFIVPVEELNDKVIRTSLKYAQTLYDTDSVDRMIVLLSKDEYMESTIQYLKEAFSQRQIKTEIKTWRELSPFYTKVRDMFDIIFLFIFFIVFVIVVTSVINTVSMSVIERTREIGTLRALGLKRRGVIRLFAMESAMLGTVGTVFGLSLTIIVWFLINAFNPQWTPPNIVNEIPLEFYLVPSYMILSFVFLVLLSTLVAVLPARTAAHASVVDALGHA